MKLVVIGPVYPYRGGIAHYTSQLSRALIKNGHETHIFSFRRQYPGWLYPGKSDKEPSQPQLQLEAKYTLDPIYPWTWINTSKAIVKLNPDVVLIHWWTTFWAPAFWVLSGLLNKKGISVIYLIHNVLPHESLPWDPWLARKVLRHGDPLLVQASNERKRLLSLLPNAKVVLCSHPVYDFFSSANPISKMEAKQQIGVNPDTPLLLFFGIIRPYKGLKYAIEAVAYLKDMGSVTHLIVAGEFWEDIDKYEDQLSKLRISNLVTFEDRYIPNEEVGILFSAADVFVAPYIEGTQSGAVTIAIAHGLPIVATECIYDKQTFNDKITRVVPPRDMKKLAQAILELIDKEGTDEIPFEQSESSWDQLVQTLEGLITSDDRKTLKLRQQ